MPRTPRVRLPGVPFHVTHRGNERRRVFHCTRHFIEYLDLLAKYTRMYDCRVWAYCLMPNHVHLLLVGMEPDSISRAVGNTQRTFARRRNKEREVTGHVWGNRHYSSALDDAHTWATVRYIERNPVRGGLVDKAVDYRWSSAPAHAALVKDDLLDPARPFPGPITDWAGWLEIPGEESVINKIRRNTFLGRPTGSDDFVAELERRTGKILRPRKRGPRPVGEDALPGRNPELGKRYRNRG